MLSFVLRAVILFLVLWSGTKEIIATPTATPTQTLPCVSVYEKTRILGGALSDQGYDITTDINGNVYITGRFQDSVNFANDWGETDIKTASPANYRDIFITKQNSDGSYGWTRRIGGAEDYDTGYAVVTDSDGNVYVTGRFCDTVDFAADWGDTDVKVSASVGYEDIFVTKILSDGNYGWTRRMGGSGSDCGYGIDVDGDGNVYVTGNFAGTVDFEQDWGESDIKVSAGGSDIFVTKMGDDGSYAWTKQMGGTSGDVGSGLAVDPVGNVYVAGKFLGTVNFASDWSGTDSKVSSGSTDAFVTKIQAGGSYEWTRKMGSSAQDEANGVTADSAGNIYLVGEFFGTVNFASDWSGSDAKASAGQLDVFVTGILADGNYAWTRRMGGAYTDYGYGIEADSSGNVYLTGLFKSTANFASDWGGTDEKLAPGTSNDAFVTRILSDSSYGWTRRIGSVGREEGKSVTVDGSGRVYVVGHFNGDAASGYSTIVNFAHDWGGTDTKVASGTDTFLVRMGCLVPTPTSVPTVTPTASPTSTRAPTPLPGHFGLEETISWGDANAESGRAIDISGGQITLVGRDNGDALILQYPIPVTTPMATVVWGGSDDSVGEWGLGAAVSGGDVYVAGSSYNFSSDGIQDKEPKGALARFTFPTSTPVWTQIPNLQSFQGLETFQDVLMEGTSLYVCGSAQYNETTHQSILAKYNNTDGAPSWSQIGTNAGSVSGIAYGLAWNNGYLYVVGEDDEVSAEAFLLKVDPSSGNQIWRKAFQPVSGLSGAHDMAADGNSLYVAGWSEVAGDRDVYVVKVDEEGNKIWELSWGGLRMDQAYGITYGSECLIVVGETCSFSYGDKDIFVLEIDPNTGATLGVELWQGASDDVAFDAAVNDDEVYVVGETSSLGAGATDLLLLRYKLPEPTATPTNPSTATPTRTPTATPTGCTLGRAMTTFNAPARPYGLAHDGMKLWMIGRAAAGSYKLHYIDGVGVQEKSFSSPTAVEHAGLGWDGRYLYVGTKASDCTGNSVPTVWRLSATGGLLDCFAGPEGHVVQGLTWDGQALRASVSLYDEAGPGTKGRIYRMTTSGAVLGYFELSFDQPAGLAWDGGYLYCLDENEGSPRIHVLTLAGIEVQSFDAPPATGAFGLTWDPSTRSLWIGDMVSQKLQGLEVCQPGPTLTPTRTPTRTPTLTRTSTPTYTRTPTRTPTMKPTKTSTPLVTTSPTKTSTSTRIPTITPTASGTATPTMTSTATWTASSTPTRTATATPGNFPAASRPEFQGHLADGTAMWGSQADLVVKIPEGGSSEDISVRFEYSPHLAGTWFPIIDSFKGHTDATGVDSKAPFFVHWDMTGIEPGEYDVRAVGIHQIHGPDPHPNTILVTNALTPTAAAHYGDSDGQGQHFVEDDVQDSEPNDVHVGTVEDNTTTFLNLPSGALNENTRIRVKINRIDLHADKLNPDGGIPEYKGVELREFLLTNGQSVLNGKYGLVAIEYPDEDQNGYVDGTAVKEGDLKFYAWDVLQGLWKEEAYTFVDPDANMMLTITGHFSLFGIIKEEGLVNDDGWLQATAMENTPETPPEEAKTSAGMEMYGDAINGGIAGLAGSNAGLTHMILGHYDSSTRWYTGLALANPNEDFACEATLKAWGNDGKWKATYREEIPPKGKMQGTIATLFSNLTGTGWIDVTSNKPLVGLEVYGDKVAGGVASLPGGEPSSELHISHYDSGKSWWTGISLTNPNNRIANVNLTAYDNLGNTKAVKSLTVNPRCKTSGVVSTWLGITKGTGSIKIKSDQPLFGVCVFGQQPGTVAKPDIAALVAQTPMTAAKFPSYLNGSGWQSSIAVVNPGDSDIVVTMTAYGWDGTLIEAKDVNLGPRQKMAGMVDNLFTLAGYGRGSVTLASEDPFCAFELFILDDGANSGIAGIEPSIPGEEVTLAHYASNAQWWTYFALWNPSGTVSKGVFEAYAESGECQEGVFLDQDGKANYGAFLSDTFKTVGTSKKTSLYPGFESQPVRVHVEEFMKNVDLENFGAANLKVLSGGR